MVLGLAVANVAFFAWSQGWLGDVVGVSPLGDREPQRIDAQVNPQNLRVLAAGASTGALGVGVAPAGAAVCLEAGPFGIGEIAQIEAAARASLPEGSWAIQRRERPGAWLVYMGKFSDREQRQKKVAELRRLNVSFDELDGSSAGTAALEPGLSFGRYSRLEDAQDQIRRLESQRVRSARIVTLNAPVSDATVRIPRADAELQGAVVSLRDSFKGKGFAPCGRA
jgi:hypothetical protein